MAEKPLPAFLKRMQTEEALPSSLFQASTADEVISIAATAGLTCTAAEISEAQATRPVNRPISDGTCTNGLRWRYFHGPAGQYVQIIGTKACFAIWCPSC